MINQYVYLKHQAQKVLILQKDYNDYVLRLNAIITDFQKSTDEAEVIIAAAPDEKKKPFLVVNRQPEHLNDSVESYLKENNLTRELQLLRRKKLLSASTPKKQSKRYRRTRSTNRRLLVIDNKQLDIPQQIIQDIQLVWPLDLSSFYISSYFGPRKPRFHSGIDLAANSGTPVKAAAAGTVVETSKSKKGYGNSVVIQHTKKYKTRYAHLQSIAVHHGDYVEAGHYIGRVGNTGNVRSKYGDGSHLHFEFIIAGRAINPIWVLPKI